MAVVGEKEGGEDLPGRVVTASRLENEADMCDGRTYPGGLNTVARTLLLFVGRGGGGSESIDEGRKD